MELTYQYSKKWRFNFNYDKCAVVVFDNREQEIKYGNCKNECTCSFHWKLGETLINQVRDYKYLGVELDCKLSMKEFKKRIVRRNVSRIWGMGMSSGSLSTKASLNLYEALVRAIVEYGSEIIGEGEWEEVEKVQREMGRRILRCHGKTSIEVILGRVRVVEAKN